ncbi:P-loop containing nucleoside triphosphate hydrolase protein [Scheffersomyces xylosifermentans]|uniref:P-loop containing nucleoside triphosphate hydrolase protein n=1 Tax=Scheffersomyces xylosifermentans TaxID=1304137 RepID=UPI00315DBA5B
MSFFGNQTCPLWDYDDFTRCGRDKLELIPPVVIGASSLSILLIKSSISIAKRNKRIKLAEGESQPLLATQDAYGAISTEPQSQPSLKSRHFDIVRLPDTNVDGSPHGVIEEVYKDTFERLRVCIEYLLVIVQLGLAISLSFANAFHKEFQYAPYIPIVKAAFWFYAFIICSIRVANLKKVNIRLPNLWVHSTAIYFFNFFPTLLTFRSALVSRHLSDRARQYYIAEFVLSAILLLLNFTAKIGDKPSTLYLTGKITPSPENVSSILSFSTYSWLDKMVWQAYKNPLKKDDIWGLRDDDYALRILKTFEASKSTAAFTAKLFTHFKLLFAVQAFWAALDSILVFAPSLLLKRVLEHVEDPSSSPASLAWTFLILMPTFKMIESMASGCSLFVGRRVCLRMKAIIIGEVYAKALRRKITVSEVNEDSASDSEVKNDDDSKKEKETGGKKTAELGAIINLMAIDAFKVSEICGYLHFFVSAILMIAICITLLYNLLGWSALVGSIAVVALLPVNYRIAQWVSSLQKDMLAITDKRIQKLNETFQSIRIIKFFAWEDKFFESVMAIRHEELNYLKWRSLVWCLGSFVWFMTPTLITLISFYCYTIIDGNTLTAPIAFTSLSLFTLLRSPLDQLSDMTSFVVQSKVSLDRVSDFLDEVETSKYDQLGKEPGPNSPYIGFENATLSWNSQSENDFKLRDLDISFKAGKLNVIIGPTGAGKTSLLLGLLGEMELLHGDVYLPGVIPRDELVIDPQTGLTESVAYCSQSAWLLNETIRNNITFGAPFNQDRYSKVVDACGLTRDFEILSAGDATEVGEKGITLSGGQKQRVSLARALYSNSKHLLLDDCLSAVDSHTALWIYENCITGPLMESRTCILVSHNVALTVQNAAWIVVMDNGRVKSQGTPEDLLNTGDLGDDDLIKSSVMSSRDQSSTNLAALGDKNADLKAKAAVIESKLKALNENNNADDSKKTDGKLVEEETKADGVVNPEVYKTYAKILGGWPTWTLILLTFIGSQSIFMFQSWWLRNWSINSEIAGSLMKSLGVAYVGNVYDSTQFKSSPIIRTFTGATHLISASIDTANKYKEEHGTLYYIIIYAIIGVAYGFSASMRVVVSFLAGIRASNRIFKKVLTTILRAKLRFFDKTPQGRIMNRFSKDIESVDQELTPMAEGVFICFVQCVSSLILITFITPGFLIFAFIISFLYYLVGVFYLTLSRELQRFESITKSPIHQHFSESLNGVATIRAYGIESTFMKQNLNAIDNNNRPFFYLWVANRWLSLRVDAVGSLVMLFTGIFVLLSVGKIDAGLAGLSLTYAIAFSESALWIVRLYANVEMNMNSVERLKEYFEVEQEPPYEIPETEPPASWPAEGRISVKDVSLRYSPELPRVIKNVTFEVEPNHKVGIVGRTGAGKSTIITAFFRFLDAETGSIHIDGIDINSIGLRNLRQAITIIPQDPTLFSGTIRSNLDPFEQYTDEQIFEALRRVNLIGRDETPNTNSGENQNKFFNLDAPIAEGGGNLSQGERQLVCLGRSLLKNPKVILLDEATSSIDYKSDAMIQQTIRDEFSNSTILTIAHRLRTIIDYDKILVMDAGRVVEYDNPYVLIADKTSLFYSMCENSGELDSLIKLAKEAFIKKKNSQTKK